MAAAEQAKSSKLHDVEQEANHFSILLHLPCMCTYLSAYMNILTYHMSKPSAS